jgi:FkbM family methyltransferase
VNVSSLISYAQNFEDVMLWRALKNVENGFYIDIGAQDPVIDSVSLAFYEKGWRGIHVEPTPHYADLLRKERPEDSVIQAAVSTSKGFLRFFEIPDSGISTADAAIAAQHVERGFKVHEITVPSIPLASIFSLCKHHEIHWLKIDVEGFESQVLSSWGKAAARPWIVVVESTLPLTQIESHAKWERHLVKHGYSYVYFDGLNRFYVSEQRPELKGAFRSGPNVFDGFVLNGTGSAPFWSLIEKRHQIELVEKAGEFEENAKRLQSQIEALEQARSKRELELEGKQNEVSSQLVQRDVECIEARARTEQLTALLQTREFELHQAVNSSAHFEGALGKSLLTVSELGENIEKHRAELVNITQQFIQNVARFGGELNVQIERNASLGAELSAERIKANVAYEALNAARAEASYAKNLYAHKEEVFGRDLAIEKARNELLEQHSQSTKIKDELRELELAKYRETTARQAEAMGKMDREFAIELNNYRERVGILERELRDEKTSSENKAVTYRLAAKDAEQAIERLNERVRALDEIVSQQSNCIHDVEQQSVLDSQQHKGSMSIAEEKITDLTHQRQLLSTQLAEQEHTASQLNETLAQVRIELLNIRATYSWKLTRPFRWAASSLKGPPSSTQSGSLSTSFARQQPSVYKQTSLTELTMSQPADQMHFSVPDFSQKLDSGSLSEDETFIKMCYQTSLGRDPDPSGAEFYLGRLKVSISRASIMDEIRASDEAKAYSQKTGAPSDKGMITIADAESLLAKQDKSFVVAAYQTLLRRSPDSGGYASYLMRLRSGVPKIQLLMDIRNSSEGQRYARPGDGLTVFIRRHKRSKIFFFGWIFRLFSPAHFTRPTESMLTAIENQMFAMADENQERASKIFSALKDAENANLVTRSLIDDKIAMLSDVIVARSLQAAEHTNKRFDNFDLMIARQTILLQKRGLESRRELFDGFMRKDAHLASVFAELQYALALQNGGNDENRN